MPTSTTPATPATPATDVSQPAQQAEESAPRRSRRTGALRPESPTAYRVADRRPPADTLSQRARAAQPVLEAQGEAVRQFIIAARKEAGLTQDAAWRRVDEVVAATGASMSAAGWNRLEREPGRAGKLSIDRLDAILYALGQTPVALAMAQEQAVADWRQEASGRPLTEGLRRAQERERLIRRIGNQLAQCPDDTLEQVGHIVAALLADAQTARSRSARGPRHQPSRAEQVQATLATALDELDAYEAGQTGQHSAAPTRRR